MSGPTPEVAAAVERLTAALGKPIATPELVSNGRGGLVRSRFRVWRWRCPCCGGGDGDPLYRPLAIDSDGWVCCQANDCPAAAIRAEVDVRLGVLAILNSLEGA